MKLSKSNRNGKNVDISFYPVSMEGVEKNCSNEFQKEIDIQVDI